MLGWVVVLIPKRGDNFLGYWACVGVVEDGRGDPEIPP